MQNLQIAILNIHKRYIHLNSKHVQDLKFGMYLPCGAFDKFDVEILKILLFGQFMAEKLPKSRGHVGFLRVFLPENGQKAKF